MSYPPASTAAALLLTLTQLTAAAQTPDLTAGRALAKATARTCRADVARLCKNTQPGNGRVLACLREQQAELSEACRTQLDKH